jgi:hypothetical protein
MTEEESESIRREFDTLLDTYARAVLAAKQIPQGRCFSQYAPEERSALVKPMTAHAKLWGWVRALA